MNSRQNSLHPNSSFQGASPLSPCHPDRSEAEWRDLQSSRKVENLTFQQSLALDLRGLFIRPAIFWTAAYSVSKRLHELGIRITLGAQRKEVLRAALGRAFRLLAIGLAGFSRGIIRLAARS
jgi:hypothetical protein